MNSPVQMFPLQNFKRFIDTHAARLIAFVLDNEVDKRFAENKANVDRSTWVFLQLAARAIDDRDMIRVLKHYIASFFERYYLLRIVNLDRFLYIDELSRGIVSYDFRVMSLHQTLAGFSI
jgi:hypothetical protein